MSEKFEEEDRLKLAQYCQDNFRQKSSLPESFIEASYKDLVSFLKREGKHVEDVFLEIFLEETPDPLDSK